MSVFNACIVQTTSLPYDKEANLNRALAWMEQAHAKGVDLILLPEMFLTGYFVKDKLRELAEDLETGEALAVLKAKAKEYAMGVVVGLPTITDPNGKPHNSVVMIDRDGIIKGAAHKTHMFGGEEKMFDPGDAQSHRAFDTSFGSMGLLVCYDGEFPETARSLALDGAEILCMCGANMFPFEDYHAVYMRARAMENMVPTLYCNYVGHEKRFHYCGQSCAYDPTGKFLAEADTQEETELYFTVDMSLRKFPLENLNYLASRKRALYHDDL